MAKNEGKFLSPHEQAAWVLYTKEAGSGAGAVDFWSQVPTAVQKKYLEKVKAHRYEYEKEIHEAWALWMEQHGSSHPEIQSWWDLGEEPRALFLKKAADLRIDLITQEELKEWFGEAMPANVFMFLFRDAPADMTIAEVKARVRQMGADYRSPESLALQANEILMEAKRHGNLAPKLVNEINAWESRYLIHRREAEQQ